MKEIRSLTLLVEGPGFNGVLHEPAIGWQILGNGYRVYNPVLMRFHSPDNLSPFGAGGLNAYAYGADDVNTMDPTGHIGVRKLIIKKFTLSSKSPLNTRGRPYGLRDVTGESELLEVLTKQDWANVEIIRIHRKAQDVAWQESKIKKLNASLEDKRPWASPGKQETERAWEDIQMKGSPFRGDLKALKSVLKSARPGVRMITRTSRLKFQAESDNLIAQWQAAGNVAMVNLAANARQPVGDMAKTIRNTRAAKNSAFRLPD